MPRDGSGFPALSVAVLAGLAGLTVVGGCAHHQYGYVPVGPGADGGPAARYPIPPEAPQGEVYVTTFGLTEVDGGPGQPGALLHARLAVSNGSPNVWNVDGQRQFLAVAGRPAQPLAYLNTDAAGAGPVYQVPPGRASVFDLYFAASPGVDLSRGLDGFALDWDVDVGGRTVAAQTTFQRYQQGAPPSYATYPPYVEVGLGFGVGWWGYPRYWHPRHFPPAIRGYYGPGRIRGGPWRGAPPPAWCAAPSRGSGWHGTPTPSPAPARSRGSAPHGRGGGGSGRGGR